MVTVLRILFGLTALILIWFGSISLGERIHTRRHQSDEIDGEQIMTLAHLLVSVLLAVFFTLWCTKVGVV